MPLKLTLSLPADALQGRSAALRGQPAAAESSAASRFQRGKQARPPAPASLSRRRSDSPCRRPVPIFLAPGQIEPFISAELKTALVEPLRYREGARTVDGFEAKWLPEICDVWLRARSAGALQDQQQERAQKAEMLMRGLAHIGIVALVDEATGYQEERARDELHRLLAVYLSEERLRWAKRFPDEFYRQLYRLRSWQWPNDGQRTPFVGKLTNRLVYDRLPPGVIEELQVRNPTQPGTGRRKWKHHQFLSEDIGQPDLRDHLMQLIAVMRVSRDWPAFEENFDRAFPGPQGRLDID